MVDLGRRDVGGEEAVLLVAEGLVEGGPRDPGMTQRVGDGGAGVAALGDRPDHTVEQPGPLREQDHLPIEAVAAPGQSARRSAPRQQRVDPRGGLGELAHAGQGE